MRWERFFDDLEDQLASEWEAERAALDSEAERLRLAHVALRERIAALAGGGRRFPGLRPVLAGRDSTLHNGSLQCVFRPGCRTP